MEIELRDAERAAAPVEGGSGIQDEDVEEETESDERDNPERIYNGAPAAALLAAGFGCALFGVLVVLAEASAGLKELLTFSEPAGSLSGKATVATVGWVALWLPLHFILRRSRVDLDACVRITAVLVVTAFVLTFPPFFQAFKP